MAVNPDRNKKMPSKFYKNCPQAILKVIPKECDKLTFSELSPGENFDNKAIVGKIISVNPVFKRPTGYGRKLVITDALADDGNQKRLTVFLFDQFAQDSDAAQHEAYIIITNFIIEKSTHIKENEMPLQVLVKKEDSQVWFGRKVASSKSNSAAGNSISRKKKKVVTVEESPAILSHQYNYTKLSEVQETDSKETFHVYGIVEKCDLKITQGRRTQILELILCDETETGFVCSVFAAKEEIFPDIYPGDIIRIHRMQVYKFRSKLKGKCLSPKFILVFSKSNQGTKPRTIAKSFTFTENDAKRVKELFEWYQEKNKPKLISEVRRGDFVNIVCQVISVYVARTTDAVILKIWDGTKTNVLENTHLGLQGEKIDQKLFRIAKNYYVILSVYGHHATSASELQPGQYIEIRDAHLFSPRNNPDECKLCLHAGNKEGRGISVLKSEDDRVILLKERLEKIIADAQEFENQTDADELLNANNSIFLNCDISVFSSSQKSNKDPDENARNAETNQEEPSSFTHTNDNKVNEDVEVLNRSLSSKVADVPHSKTTVTEAAIKHGQSTQEFGEGMLKEFQSTQASQDTAASTSIEPDPTCNKTPLEMRFFVNDPLNLSSQIDTKIFHTFSASSQEEWWTSVPTVSTTDDHSNIRPSSIEEVVKHSGPFKFRIFAVVLGFKPDITSFEDLIHLYCPECFYITQDIQPSFEAFETREGLSYFHCPECSSKQNDTEKWPVLEYTYLISFALHDGTGPSFIEVYLWRENAVKFFKNIHPEEALRDKTVADSILHMLWSICPNCRPFNLKTDSTNNYNPYPTLDCCILSYSTVNFTRYQ
ncbi:Protection of telomeres protein 1, partial [Stegodyphus mimosarum]